MYYTESNVIIHADAKEVYNIVKDVCKWPEIFPPCKCVKILKEEDQRIEIELTAITRKKEFSWKSERIYDDKNRTVFFRQFEPAKPLKFMTGKWIVEESNGNSLVKLTHEFDVNVKYFKRLLSFIARVFFIDTNSERELNGLKLYLERN